MNCTGNATSLGALSPGRDTAHDARVQSLLTAAMGLTSLGAPVSPSPATNKASVDPNRSENAPARSATSVLAAPSPPLFKKSPAGVSNLRGPFVSFSTDAAMATGRFSASGPTAAAKSAAIDVPPPPPGRAPPSGRSGAPLPTPASLPAGASAAKTFPATLLEVLSSDSDTVAWLPHGRGLVILDRDRFTRDVLPRHFEGCKWTSFARRMKRWGFERVPRGPEMGAYYHPEFRRDRPELVEGMRYGGTAGKFMDIKKKKKEKEKEKLRKEKKKQKGEKASENEKVRQSLSNEVLNVPLNDDPRGLPREDKYEKPQVLSATPKMDTWYYPTNPQDLQSQTKYSSPHVLSENKPIETWLLANTSLRDQGRSIPLPSASSAFVAHEKTKHAIGSCAAHNNISWLENQAELLRHSMHMPSSFPRGLPISGALSYPNQQRIAEIQQELLLTRSVLSLSRGADNLVPGSGTTTTGAAGVPSTMANGSIPDHRLHGALTHDLQRTIDVELARRTLQAESIAGLGTRQGPAPSGGANPIDAIIASNRANAIDATVSRVLGSSETHANVTDAESRAENEHVTQVAAARKNAAWLEIQANLLRQPSCPRRIPDPGAPIDLNPREPRIANIQRQLLLTQSMLPRKVTNPESVTELCVGQKLATPDGRANAINAIMASKVQASSNIHAIHASVMDAVARDLRSRPNPEMPVSVPPTQGPPPRGGVGTPGAAETPFARSA